MRDNRSSGFLIRSNTNWPVQSQKQARTLKIRIEEEEELYYLCSKNKGAGQLCSYLTELICVFVSACAIIRFSHDAVHMALAVELNYKDINTTKQPTLVE